MNNFTLSPRLHRLPRLAGLLSILTVIIAQTSYSQEKTAVAAPARVQIKQLDGINNLLSVPGDENWDNRMGFPNTRYEESGNAIAVIDSEIYMGGSSSPPISKWNVNRWSALPGGPGVEALAVIGNDLYVGGYFIRLGDGAVANRIAKWNRLTQKWSVLKNDTSIGIDSHERVYLSSEIRAMVVRGHDLYMGGRFTYAGGIVANNIAKWNSLSNRWSPLGNGIDDGYVFAIAVYNGEIYVGGHFSSAGGVPANNIAKWNGRKWSALGSGVKGNVYAIGVFGKEVYVGGSFSEAGGLTAKNIAKWNPADNSWSSLNGDGTNNGTNIIVLAIASNDRFVYVGGGFAWTDGQKIDGIAKWDPIGNRWLAMGSGVYGAVKSIVVHGNDVLVAGTILKVGGKDSKNFGVWHEPKNHAPPWSKIPELSFNEDDSLLYPIRNCYDYVTDVVNPDSALFFRIFSSREVKAVRRDKNFLFTAAPNWFGVSRLKLVVRDRRGLADTTTLVVKVNPVNDPPVWRDLPDSLALHNNTSTELNLWEFAHDLETPDSLLHFNFSTSKPGLNIAFDKKTGQLKLNAPNFSGRARLYVTVRDWKRAAARDTIFIHAESSTLTNEAAGNEQLPAEFVLEQNYPNPFSANGTFGNPTTLIRFGLPQEAEV